MAKSINPLPFPKIPIIYKSFFDEKQLNW